MNSFPRISNDLITACFDRLTVLFSYSDVKILEAAERATSMERNPFVKTVGTIAPQLLIIRNKIGRIGDEYGQKFLFKLIEELYDDLVANGAVGVNNADFINSASITLHDKSSLQYSSNKLWKLTWGLEADGNTRSVEMCLRGKLLPIQDVVPDHILQYVQQSVIAFQNSRHAVSLALMSIALEGTLRDALATKGYNYQYGNSANDVYQLEDIQVHKDPNGFKVTFPTAMPLSHTQYLSAPGDPTYKTFKIKRIIKGQKTFLEIRPANDLVDYWSSSTIVTRAVVQVSGLGAALDISRNREGILTQVDLPDDLDAAIQAVRNNLIHLSGTAMNVVVETDSQNQQFTLHDFLKNKNKVFDAVITIAETVNTIYQKISAGTL